MDKNKKNETFKEETEKVLKIKKKKKKKNKINNKRIQLKKNVYFLVLFMQMTIRMIVIQCF